jgi:putative membrane protein
MAETSAWRRLSPWSVVFILLKGAVRTARENLPVLVGVGAGIALIERIGARELIAAAIAVAVVGAAISVVYYRRFRYHLTGEVLRVRRGLLEVVEIELRADRIQHIGVREPLSMRPFGLAVVRVSTPGGGKHDVELPGIRRQRAHELVDALTNARGEVAPPDDDPHALAADVRFRASPLGITLHGVANQSILVAVAAAAPILAQLIPRLEGAQARALGEAVQELGVRLGSHTAAWTLLALTALALLLAGSILIAWVQYAGYELRREGDRYAQRSGLLSRQEQLLATPRVQAIDWVETAVGRALGRSYLVCRQIGSASKVAEPGGAFVIPALDRQAAARLLDEIWPGTATTPALHRPHRAYRRVLMLRASLPAGLIFTLAAAAMGEPRWLLALPVALLALWPLAYARWRAFGYRLDDRFLWVRRGLLGRRRVIAPPARAQRVVVSQSLLQRRRELASLTLTLAHGPVTIPYISAAEARRLADRVLAAVETTRAHL